MSKHEAFSTFAVGEVPDTWETICPECHRIDPERYEIRFLSATAIRCGGCGFDAPADEWGKPYEGEAEVEES